ncbi:hypothetical protein KKC13_05665 [bacterium]|nr:hypothetical protein [bacterium]MBU1957336.1 hypothetical protein [bacterium]
MINIIIEISLFLIIALLLGYTFGWFTSKAMLKEKYERQIHEFNTLYEDDLGKIHQIKKELERYKQSNNALNTNHSEITKKIEELEHFVQSKDDIIEKLTTQLSLEEDKRITLAKKHEEEMDAFLYERTEITQKYKTLLAHLKEKVVDHDEGTHDESWFGKLFREPSKS